MFGVIVTGEDGDPLQSMEKRACEGLAPELGTTPAAVEREAEGTRTAELCTTPAAVETEAEIARPPTRERCTTPAAIETEAQGTRMPTPERCTIPAAVGAEVEDVLEVRDLCGKRGGRKWPYGKEPGGEAPGPGEEASSTKIGITKGT